MRDTTANGYPEESLNTAHTIRPVVDSRATASETLKPAENVSSQIRALIRIAKVNGSLVTIKDITALTAADMPIDQLEHPWSSIRELCSIFLLQGGFVLEAGQMRGMEEKGLLEEELNRRARATVFVQHARDFASSIQEGARLLSISGSTSYLSVSATDDLDFFCVARSGSLWIFLSKALLMARCFRLLRKRTPRICFSYAVDEDFVMREFSLQSDALFARDALTAIVLHGGEYYSQLLMTSSWISRYFPRAYSQRISMVLGQKTHERGIAPSTHTRFLNLLLWTLVGRYISVKSVMLNRKFRKQGRFSSLFMAKTGPDHCVFESAQYSKLRAMYREIESELTPTSQHTIRKTSG